MKKTLEELNAELSKLDLTGRDDFHTHLIQQEVPFWMNAVYDGDGVSMNEVRDIARRRGFNLSEKRKFGKLARWLNEHAAELRACRPAESKHRAHMRGWEDGARGSQAEKKDSLYLSGYAAGRAARKAAAGKFARQIGYEIPRKKRAGTDAKELRKAGA